MTDTFNIFGNDLDDGWEDLGEPGPQRWGRRIIFYARGSNEITVRVEAMQWCAEPGGHITQTTGHGIFVYATGYEHEILGGFLSEPGPVNLPRPENPQSLANRARTLVELLPRAVEALELLAEERGRGQC